MLSAKANFTSDNLELIHFNVPPYTGLELEHIDQAVTLNRKISGDGPYTALCNNWLENRFGIRKAMLTTSGTSALEMAAMLCDFRPGDEVILPSYTFTSTATAFAIAGASLVFVDIRPDTMNINEMKIESAISDRTRAICVVHYAGIACEMDRIMAIAKKHNLYVIEDAAQGVLSSYKGAALGSIGDFGCYSFHETKNYSMGEGGAILVNREDCCDRAEIIREKGTNRSQFFRGEVDKYRWVDLGSSYLPSELNAAYLWAQLEKADMINDDRLNSWNHYQEALSPLEIDGELELPHVPDGCTHNAHMFYIKLANLDLRTSFIEHMKERNILCVFHYVPLHSSPAGTRFGTFHGDDEFTTAESERLVRLPLYYGLTESQRERVIDGVYSFFR